jgi:hypothetical protein
VRTVIYSMGVSLDCYIAGPDGNDWGAPDAELHRFHNQQTSELGLHLLGRRLYEVMAFWETAEERNPSAPASVSELDVAQLEFARIWKQLPKLVFSKSLDAPAHRRVPLVRLPRGPRRRQTLLRSFFAYHTRVNLELLETRAFSNRVVYLRYRRA